MYSELNEQKNIYLKFGETVSYLRFRTPKKGKLKPFEVLALNST